MACRLVVVRIAMSSVLTATHCEVVNAAVLAVLKP